MTEDEQEALSVKYVMPRAMRLSSGRFALWLDGQEMQIVDGHTLLSKLPGYEELAEQNKPIPRSPTGKITSLNLSDLGL